MALELDQSHLEFLQAELRQHTLPSTSLGTTGGSLAHKFHAVLHSIFLESGPYGRDLVSFCKQICACTTDLGTEFSLPFISPMKVSSIFPWIRQQDGEEIFAAASADDFHLMEVDAEYPDEVSLSSSLAFPGLLHIIHNAASDVLTVTELLDSQVDNLAKVCSLLSERQTCTKPLETCFNSPVGQQLQHRLAVFSCKVYRPRWGSVAFCCKSLLEVKSVLVFGWSLQKYSAGLKKIGTDLEVANNSITSPLFWASILVLDHLYDLVRSCFQWAEGCPCHSHLEKSDVSKQVRQRWDNCPLRGLRVPEICAGDFFQVFQKLQNEATVSLVSCLTEISVEDKAKLLQEFEKGRSFLLHTFTLKLAAFSLPPLLVSAAAHHFRPSAEDALRTCLQCNDDHPKIKCLQSDPVKWQAEEFLDGAELGELPDLCVFLAGLRFCHAVERKVEGGHARVLRRGRSATQHSEAFDSLALRMSEINSHFDSDSLFLEALAGFVSYARSPKDVVAKLGMGRHPACCDVRKHAWDKLYRQIVYRADKETLYQVKPPCIALIDFKNSLEDEQPLQRQIIPADMSAHYSSVLREAALEFFHAQLNDFESEKVLRIYSCNMLPQAATVSLQRRMMQAHEGPDRPLPLSFPEWVPDDGKLWFSLVSASPYRSKRAKAGYLARTDMAIAVHHCLGCKDDIAYVLSTPVNLGHSQTEPVSAEEVSLILTTHMIELASFRNAVCWQVSQQIFYVLDTGSRPLHFDEEASDLIEALLSNVSFQVCAEHPLFYLQKLQSWKELPKELLVLG